MRIGEASAASGVSAKMLRYYEDIGLIRPAFRDVHGYRSYDTDDVNRLRFIHLGRECGLSVGQIRDLLSLWNKDNLASEISRLAVQNMAELDVRIDRMKMLRQAVEDLVSGCERERRPHSPAVP